jgi:hypothetical protein
MVYVQVTVVTLEQCVRGTCSTVSASFGCVYSLACRGQATLPFGFFCCVVGLLLLNLPDVAERTMAGGLDVTMQQHSSRETDVRFALCIAICYADNAAAPCTCLAASQ